MEYSAMSEGASEGSGCPGSVRTIRRKLEHGRRERWTRKRVSLTFRAKWANEAATYERVEVRRPLDRTLRA